jgi:rubrerythrin
MTREKLIKALEEQLQLEKDSARTLRAEQKTIDHIGIKAFFEICAADSTKHASLIQMMLTYLKDNRLSEESFVSTWQQRHKGVEAIKEHINREKQMIERLKDQVLATDDPIIKALLKHMLADEDRHHQILKQEIWDI